MKKVLSSDMVAHTWANQSQDEARTTTGNLYFNGDSIFSYGRHFCIARHVKGAILFTTRSYSNTTAKHISIVRQACRDQKIIYCPDPRDSTWGNFDNFTIKIKNALYGLDKAKKPEKYIGPANSIFERAKIYADFMGVKIPLEMVELIASVNNGVYKDYLKKEAERIQKEREEAETRQLIQFKIDLVEWRKGKTHRLYNSTFDYLRINPKNRIETSQNIEIPMEIAKRTYNFIIGSLKTGGCIGCDHRILDYGIKEVTKDHVKVGCHTIQMAEIKKMAKKLGW
jgi:hypothetical protein